MPNIILKDAGKLKEFLSRLNDSVYSSQSWGDRLLDQAFTEEKEVPWVPAKYETYYYIGHANQTVGTINDSSFDKQRIAIGNCFRSETEAQAIADKFKELLKNK